MITKEKTTEKMIQVPESALLALVANSLKDRVLFPQMVADAQKYLAKAKLVRR